MVTALHVIIVFLLVTIHKLFAPVLVIFSHVYKKYANDCLLNVFFHGFYYLSECWC